MATSQSFLDNFPVRFNWESDSCLQCDGRDFCQLAQWSDRFEFAIEPSTTDVTVVNGTFTGSLAGWTVDVAGWTYSSGKARLSAALGQMSQNINQIIGRKYKVTFTVSNYSYGEMRVNIGNVFSVANVTANGTYSFYITPVNSSYFYFVEANNGNVLLDIDNVTVELVSEDCGIELYNTETGTYSGIRKYANLTSPYIATLGYSYLWSDMGLLYDACYKIVVYDKTTGPNIIINGDFTTNLNGWSASSVSWSAGTAHFVPIVGNETIEQSIAGISIGDFIVVTITVSSFISGAISGVLNGSGDVVFADISANGTYIGYVVATAGANGIIFQNNVNNTDLKIDNVTFKIISCTQSSLSECYNIKTDQGCTTKMLSWTNGAVNGFNYPYYFFYNANSQYGYQWMRVEADLRNSKYPGQEEKYIDSGGNNKLYYSSSRKQKELIIGAMPEYMHDALSIGLIHKEFYIDGVRYSFEDSDYTPQWSSEIPTILAESQVLVGKYTQDLKQID